MLKKLKELQKLIFSYCTNAPVQQGFLALPSKLYTAFFSEIAFCIVTLFILTPFSGVSVII
jgi:hypothetical protein